MGSRVARLRALPIAIAVALVASPAARPATTAPPDPGDGGVYVRVLPPPRGCSPVEPAIVFLPALGFTGESFAGVAERITSCRARVLVDLPGTGQSAPSPRLDDDAVVRALARRIARRGRVVLVGHSLGGVIAVRLAAAAPAHVAALVLVDAPVAPFPLAWWQHAALHPLVWSPLLHLLGAARATRFALRRLGEHPTAGSAESIDLLGRELSSRASRRVLLAYHRAFLQPAALRRAERDLGGVRVPVLVLWGRHDHVVPPSEVAETVAALPAATPVIARTLPTGHLAPLDEPAAVAAAISDFLRQVPLLAAAPPRAGAAPSVAP